MNGSFRIGLLATAAWLALLSVDAAAQTASPPDLTGVYLLDGDHTELHPSDGSAVPLTAAGKKLYDRNKSLRAKRNYEPYDLTMDRCASPGAVRMMTLPYAIEFFQRPHQIAMLFEFNHLYRLIHLTEQKKVAPYPMAIGVSNARWEGETLIIETSDIADNTLLDTSGLPHSNQLRVTERIRLIDGKRLENVMTLHDPQMFTKDWSTTLSYLKTQADGVKQDVCLDRVEIENQPAIKGQQPRVAKAK